MALESKLWEYSYEGSQSVLILVLVEDGFRGIGLCLMLLCGEVLILVLVEDGFRGSWEVHMTSQLCLNPCSCGRWLQSWRTAIYV